jgi:CheY-like chemotaxis protein
MMPEIDGIELAGWLRKAPQHRTTPIVMLTSMSEKSFIDRAFLAGATDYITKPFDAMDLTTRVQMAERQIQASRAANDSAGQILALTAQIDKRFAAPLSEPIALEDVDGLIDYLAMQNYLLQMSRGSFVGTSLFALRIADVGDIYAKASPALFHDILADVAECTLKAMCNSECIMSYAGNGSFAGVMGMAEGFDSADLEIEINMMIERLHLTDDRDQPLTVRVAVGAPQSIGMLHSGRWVINQMQRAIEDLAWAVPKANRGTLTAATPKGRLMRAFTQTR